MEHREVRTDFYVNKIIDGTISYWKFLETATPKTFMDAYEIFKAQVNRSTVKGLMVVVEMQDAWSRDVQHIWIQTGDVAERCGIERWGVVSSSTQKLLTIRRLVSGAGERNRAYDYMVSPSEDEVLAWLRSEPENSLQPAAHAERPVTASA